MKEISAATDTGKASVPATPKSFPHFPFSRKYTPDASVTAMIPKKAACIGMTGSAASPAATPSSSALNRLPQQEVMTFAFRFRK